MAHFAGLVLSGLTKFVAHEFPVQPAQNRNIVKNITPKIVVIALFADLALVIKGDPAGTIN